MEQVYILLSTYNGEKYLRQQLDSLVAQTYKHFQIIIWDDGSKDKTIEIIQEYINRFPKLFIFLNDANGSIVKNFGYPDCFWNLLQNAPANGIYSFCDQDDVWDKDKLKYAVQALSLHRTCPSLYIHDSEICDSKGNTVGLHKLSDAGDITHTRIMFYTIAQGYSMVINSSMREILIHEQLERRDLSHDQWIIWTAFFRGKIIGDTRILAKYRRHDETVTKTSAGKLSMLYNWFVNEIFGDEFSRQCERLRYALICNKDTMSSEQIRDWITLLPDTNSVNVYFKRLFFPKRLRPSVPGEIVLRINFLLGLK